MGNNRSIQPDEFRPLYGNPADHVVDAHAPFLEDTCKQFISSCTLMVLSSTNDQGYIDMSPRGGTPGFIRILDDRHIAFLDQPGNKKLHTISNLASHSKVGMLFMIPGVTEVLRAYGTASAEADQQIISDLGGHTSRNRTVIRIRIDRIFPHCSAALNKACLWKPDRWPVELAEKIPDIYGLGSSISAARAASEERSDD